MKLECIDIVGVAVDRRFVRDSQGQLHAGILINELPTWTQNQDLIEAFRRGGPGVYSDKGPQRDWQRTATRDEIINRAIAAAEKVETQPARKIEVLPPRQLEITAYTGGALSTPWLDDPIILDLAGIDVRGGVLPILDNHIAEAESIVGQSRSATVEGSDLVLRGDLFMCNDACFEIAKLAAQGFEWQASVRARCFNSERYAQGETVQVNGRNFAGPVYVARTPVLMEVSIVVIGEDHQTTVSIREVK
jgi:hypothetical protein